MSLTTLIIGGFKSIRERTEIPIAPLTLLFGPNSAGKSAVLRAMEELQRRLLLKEDPDPEVERWHSWQRGMTTRFAFQPPNAKVQYRAYVDRKLMTVASRSPLVLGLEVDALEDVGSSFDRELDSVLAAGIQAYGALCGRRVRLEVVDTLNGANFKTTITVDEKILLEVADGSSLSRTFPKLKPRVALGRALASRRTEVPSLNDDEQLTWLDGLVINTDHPALHETEISALCSAIKHLKGAHPLVDALTLLRGHTLVLRTRASPNRPYGWGRVSLAQGLLSEVARAALHEVPAGPQASGHASVVELIDRLFHAVAVLMDQVRYSLSFELDIEDVSGDRAVLTPEQTTWEFMPQSPGLGPEQATWVLRPQRAGQASTSMSSYAEWLGTERAQSNGRAQRRQGRIERDDFVNDVLLHDLLSLRKYRIEPEVWRIVETPLTKQRGGRPGNRRHYLRVGLFLVDGHQRRLEFEEVGSGVSYLLPVLAALWHSNRSWVEQPELHLHPAAQCELGDVFLRAYNRGRFSVVETHSEHLLLRILKRIRQSSRGEAIDSELRCIPEAVAVYYFDPQEDGSTRVKRLRVTRFGDFSDRWPAGFFEERDGELFDE